MTNFKIGDKVQQTHSLKKGTIVFLYKVIPAVDDTFDAAVVKWEDGTQYSTSITSLTKQPKFKYPIGTKIKLYGHPSTIIRQEIGTDKNLYNIVLTQNEDNGIKYQYESVIHESYRMDMFVQQIEEE